MWCGTQRKPPCVDSRRPRVYRHHARMCQNMRAWCRYTRGRLESTHGGFFCVPHGEGEGRKRGRVSPSVVLTMNGPRSYPLLERFTERNPWILQISSLRIDHEQHAPDSSNHSLSLLKLSSFSCPEGHCGGNDKHTTHPPSPPPPLPPSSPSHTTQHTHTITNTNTNTNTKTHTQRHTHTNAHAHVYVQKNIVEGHKLRTADI